ncbi:MAG: SBBP repeat-containing protein [Thermoplasmata archaeon]|nr:SBBP repeat-containing protein [Thermoplasmata archaeon]
MENEQDNSYDLETPEEVQHNLASMPGWFTENQGQIENADVKFVYVASDCSIGFVESGYLLKLTNEDNRTSVVMVSFEGANPVTPEGRGELSHKSNYFLGNDSEKWRTGVTNYQEVVYENLYDGIELVFYTTEKGLKYDFVVFPGANPEEICFSYEGVNDIYIDSMGNLHLTMPSGEMVEETPFSYQIKHGEMKKIDSHFQVLGKKVNFIIGRYDPSNPLIIDPLIYSTFVGGINGDGGSDIVMDSEKNAYITGSTYSPNFPTTLGAYDTYYNGDWDVVVFKLDSSGSSLLYSTFVGGSDWDAGYAMAIDDEGNAYVTGSTTSQDFPTTSEAYDTSYSEREDIFVLKLDSRGSNLEYSTYIGGNDTDEGYAITIDFEGNAYITGWTWSVNFPTTVGAFDNTYNGWGDTFVVKLNEDGSSIIFSTFMGGYDVEEGWAIEVDDDHNIYVGGYSSSPNCPTTMGAYDNIHNGLGPDVLIFKLNSEGSFLIYSTFVGGLRQDVAWDMKIDESGCAYVSGETSSEDFPTTGECYDNTYNEGRDSFAFKLDADGSALLFSTFIGGSNWDEACGLAINSGGDVIITGWTRSTDFPITSNAYDTSHNGGYDVFLLQLNSDGSSLQYSTFIGGINDEIGTGVEIIAENNIYITGRTSSFNFPIAGEAYDSSFNGDADIFVMQLNIIIENIPPIININSPPNNSEVSGNITINGSAMDENGNVTIENVEISIDGGDWEIVNGTSTWDYEWNTTTVENGEHNLRFRAYDGELYSDIEQLILDVQNDQENHPPDVTINSPDNNDEVSDTITISGESSDEDGNETIEKVEISIDDDGSWEVVTGTTSWSYDWDTTSVENGEHTLRFRAYDGIDYSDVEELTLIVENENVKPEVTIDYPEDYSEVTGLVTITGSASDEDGDETIEEVEVSIDGGGWEGVSGTTSWSYDWDTTQYADGEYTLKFRAFDGTDYSDVEELILIVKNEIDNIKPEVTIISPIHNSDVSGEVYCSGRASDDDGEIEKVEISTDDGLWLPVQGTVYWTYEWDTREFENGVYFIRVRSYDGEDYSEEVSITVTVNNQEDDGSDDEWYEEPIYLGGITSAIILVVVIASFMILRKRREGEYYGDWGEEEVFEVSGSEETDEE